LPREGDRVTDPAEQVVGSGTLEAEAIRSTIRNAYVASPVRDKAEAQLDSLLAYIKQLEEREQELRTLLSNRVTSHNVYGCRYCGVFAYSPPIIHRPEAPCDPGSYEMWSLEVAADDAVEARIKQLEGERDEAQAVQYEWASEFGKLTARLEAVSSENERLWEALKASDALIRFLRPDLSHTRPRADEVVARNRAALARTEEQG
jgi:hypothetical protein